MNCMGLIVYELYVMLIVYEPCVMLIVYELV